jgi:hypothetical protein
MSNDQLHLICIVKNAYGRLVLTERIHCSVCLPVYIMYLMPALNFSVLISLHVRTGLKDTQWFGRQVSLDIAGLENIELLSSFSIIQCTH